MIFAWKRRMMHEPREASRRLLWRSLSTTPMTNYLTEDQVLDIPTLVDRGMTCGEIGEKYGVHERTINGWIKRLRAEGHVVNTKKGRPPMIIPKAKLNETDNQKRTA